MSGGLLHLVRRAVSSFANSPVDGESLSRAADVLLPGELELWRGMQPRDQRHSLRVLDRFDGFLPGAARAERAAALLHDVGKSASDLGWTARIVATVAGPRTRRMSVYIDHERVGAGMLVSVSDPVTVSLVGGGAAGPAADALRRADDL